VGLLKPAHYGANGYRFYEEPQLLTLQQILFYQELGFELKEVKRILGQADFEKVAALRSHRTVLQKNLTRIRTLFETIDKTIQHLEGAKRMQDEEIFAGFNVPAGCDRFDEQIKLGGEPLDCKVSAKDTDGAMCAFEFTSGWPRHVHHDQDEWIYIVDGEWVFQVGDRRFHASAGESVFLPRNVPHVWALASDQPGRIIDVYQPAGKIEEFFRALANFEDPPTAEQVIKKTYTEDQVIRLRRLFQDHGMDLLSPYRADGELWNVGIQRSRPA
jgi:DNA-binding transcriptional MerR regulator/quercetin dioxygenase-like cupin family protein